MKVYQTDSEGVLVREITLDDSDKCQITSEYLIPGGCIETSPPYFDAKTQTCKWKDGKWVVGDIPADMLCYFNNGLSYKTVDSTYAVTDGEVLFSNTPTIEELKSKFSGYTVAYKQQQITKLDAEYQPQFDALGLAWATASMDGNTTLADSIKVDKVALMAEYTAKREAIING